MELIAGIAQQQSLSPQMQQSLQLLQAPVAELRQLVSTELASNPLLEEDTPELASDASDARREQQLSSLQEEWREYLPQGSGAGSYSAEDDERRKYLLD